MADCGVPSDRRRVTDYWYQYPRLGCSRSHVGRDMYYSFFKRIREEKEYFSISSKSFYILGTSDCAEVCYPECQVSWTVTTRRMESIMVYGFDEYCVPGSWQWGDVLKRESASLWCTLWHQHGWSYVRADWSTGTSTRHLHSVGAVSMLDGRVFDYLITK